MAEHVEAGGGGDGGRQCAGVIGIDDAERGPQIAVGDAGFCFALDKIKNGHAGGFAAGAGGGGNGDQRLERPWNRLAATDGSVDVVEEISRVGRIEIGGLGGVDGAAAADGDERIEVALLGDGNGVVKAAVRRLALDGVEGFEVDFGLLKRLADDVAGGQVEQFGVDDQQCPLEAHVLQVHADFAGGAGAEAEVGGGKLEGGVELSRGHWRCVGQCVALSRT